MIHPFPEPPIADAVVAPAAEICRSAPAAGPWRSFPCEGLAAEQHFAELVDSVQLEEAVRFTAAWLGPRAAVWWGALCVWDDLRAADPSVVANQFEAIDAAVAWVVDPSEELRRNAEAAGKRAGLGTAAGTLAVAAFWSGGSVSLPEQPSVDPPAGMTAKLVAATIRRCGAAPSHAVRDAKLRRYLRMAAELLNSDGAPLEELTVGRQ